jgi:TetR/AcrR family transcriptional repressor of nem operon
MARPKEFDKDEALQKAMNVFWCRGFEATSMQDVVDAMGIKRQSLYDTFGGKHQLYLAALDRYRAEQDAKLLALLGTPGPVKEKLRKLFYEVIEVSIRPRPTHRRARRRKYEQF